MKFDEIKYGSFAQNCKLSMFVEIDVSVKFRLFVK